MVEEFREPYLLHGLNLANRGRRRRVALPAPTQFKPTRTKPKDKEKIEEVLDEIFNAAAYLILALPDAKSDEVCNLGSSTVPMVPMDDQWQTIDDQNRKLEAWKFFPQN